MTELADKIEAAEGPSRELDAEIAVALKIGARGVTADDHEYLSLPDKRDPGPGVHPGHYWFHCRSGMSLRAAKAYTASLDAAMTLVPEGMDWFRERGRHVPYVVSVDGPTCRYISECDSSLSLALCAAALRAGGTDAG